MRQDGCFKTTIRLDKYGGIAYDTSEDCCGPPRSTQFSVCAANCAHAELTIHALKIVQDIEAVKPIRPCLICGWPW